MDLSEYLQWLYDYHCWATNRLLTLAAAVPPADYQRPHPSGQGSLQRVLTHLYVAEWRWRERCERGGCPLDPPGLPALTTPTALAEALAGEQARWRVVLAATEPDRLVRYQRTDGGVEQQRFGEIVAHLVNHGTQHRAEAAWILTELGSSPGDLDLIVYLRARPAGS
ncbi:MAG: hypothetical protein KatS3mg061_2763 [Dehalococcoidia bacterium]|nr:MAG: hypothetical protein KatS3mg061_2763 [Dehalococcoidia bacterium]